MNNLKSMKEQLTNVVQAQMGNMQNVNAKELGEAVDMIKDLSEAIYYCTITEAMEEKEKEEMHYYTDKRYPDYYRDVDREYGRMYYDDRIIKIHPSYNILSSTTNKIEDNRKKYKIYFDRNDLKKNTYFKIYQNKNTSYLFTIINSDRIKDYDKYLFNRIFDSKKVESSIVVCKNNCTFLMWRYLCLNDIKVANNSILLHG